MGTERISRATLWRATSTAVGRRDASTVALLASLLDRYAGGTLDITCDALVQRALSGQGYWPWTVDVLHNVQRTPEGRHAVWDRIYGPAGRRGDLLRFVGTLTVWAQTNLDAAEQVFEIGNVDSGSQVTTYRSWQVRSLSVGDVLVCRSGANQPSVVLACETTGWIPITEGLDYYTREDVTLP